MQTLGATGTLRHHFTSIIDSRGVAGLYRAVFPTMFRAGILTSAQLGVYDQAKHSLMDDFPGIFQEGFSTHFAASGIAGFACSAASSPVDVVKVSETPRVERVVADPGEAIRAGSNDV